MFNFVYFSVAIDAADPEIVIKTVVLNNFDIYFRQTAQLSERVGSRTEHLYHIHIHNTYIADT